MREKIFSNKSLVSALAGIIVGFIVVMICAYLIPFGNMYDDLVVKNLDLTSDKILTKFVFRTSLIMVSIFVASYLITKLIFSFNAIKEKLVVIKETRTKEKPKKEKIVKEKVIEEKFEIENNNVEVKQEDKKEEPEKNNVFDDIDNEF